MTKVFAEQPWLHQKVGGQFEIILTSSAWKHIKYHPLSSLHEAAVLPPSQHEAAVLPPSLYEAAVHPPLPT